MRHRLAHWDPCKTLVIWSRLCGKYTQPNRDESNSLICPVERGKGSWGRRQEGNLGRSLKICRSGGSDAESTLATALLSVNVTACEPELPTFPLQVLSVHLIMRPSKPFSVFVIKNVMPDKTQPNHVTIVFLSLFLLPCPLAIKKGSWFVKICLSLSHVDYYIWSVTIV